MSCSRQDLHHFVGILDGWVDNPQVPGIFNGKPQLPTNAWPVKPVDKSAAHESKWGAHQDATIKEVEGLDVAGLGWGVYRWIGKMSAGLDVG